jgi:16S rRNA (guanine527-N7)-methyltransferase
VSAPPQTPLRPSTAASLALAAAGVGVPLTDGEAERLFAYAGLLQHWNRSINLTASESLAEILERQVLDCLMVERLPWEGEALVVADIGSGAGLPGLVLAVKHPLWSVTSLERVAKKVTFQREAVRILGLSNVTVLREDAAEHAAGEGRAHYDVALARAYADLARTLPLAAGLLRPGGVLRTYKGRKLAEERAAIPRDLRALFAHESREIGYGIPGTEVAGIVVEFRRV